MAAQGPNRLVLASASPRRRELLERLTSDFLVVPSGIDETRIEIADGRVLDRARAKARAVHAVHDGVIIAADTVVILDGQILGKPDDRAEARSMLRRLSERCHTVSTGLCVLDGRTGIELSHCEETAVTFRTIDDAEVEAYLATDEYRDKAGGYAIQGVAAKFVCRIDGDYTNVIGLPLCRLTLLLWEVGQWAVMSPLGS
mgnify:CR=1 FL=1